MSTPRLMGYLALSASLAVCGCGTLANVDGRRLPGQSSPPGEVVAQPFGGVRRDLEWIKSGSAPANLKYVADLPLSAVGDLLTLPTTVIGVQSDTLLQGTPPVPSDAAAGRGVVPDPMAGPPSLAPSAN